MNSLASMPERSVKKLRRLRRRNDFLPIKHRIAVPACSALRPLYRACRTAIDISLGKYFFRQEGSVDGGREACVGRDMNGQFDQLFTRTAHIQEAMNMHPLFGGGGGGARGAPPGGQRRGSR